jgi:hypothetical protein
VTKNQQFIYACDVRRYKHISSKIPDFDVLQAIRFFLSQENFQFKHVKGHQDRDNTQLDIYAELNVHADELAGQKDNFNEYGEEDNIQLKLQNEQWILFSMGLDTSAGGIFQRQCNKKIRTSMGTFSYKKTLENCLGDMESSQSKRTFSRSSERRYKSTETGGKRN